MLLMQPVNCGTYMLQVLGYAALGRPRDYRKST
jgi:hypothetical protein